MGVSIPTPALGFAARANRSRSAPLGTECCCRPCCGTVRHRTEPWLLFLEGTQQCRSEGDKHVLVMGEPRDGDESGLTHSPRDAVISTMACSVHLL